MTKKRIFLINVAEKNTVWGYFANSKGNLSPFDARTQLVINQNIEN